MIVDGFKLNFWKMRMKLIRSWFMLFTIWFSKCIQKKWVKNVYILFKQKAVSIEEAMRLFIDFNKETFQDGPLIQAL